MEAFFIYLIKSAGLLTLFYVCYRLLLAKETFFTPNRHFLLAGVLISFLMPLYYLTQTIHVEQVVVNLTASGVKLAQASPLVTGPFDWWKALAIVYGLGILFLLGKFCIQLWSLVQLIQKGEHSKTHSFTLVETDYNTSPFSFFNYIVYNPKMHNGDALQTIIAHEKVHARQKHSADMLSMHLLCIAQWFNPFAWWYKRASAQNLEYIADAAITENFECKKDYQYLLLNQSKTTRQDYSIINPFFNSLIKKRIIMINQQKSKPFNALKFTLVLPFLVLFLFVVNTKTIAQTKVHNVTETSGTIAGVTLYGQVNKNSTNLELAEQVDFFNKKYKINLRFYAIERNSKNEITKIKSEFKDFIGNQGNWISNLNQPIAPFRFIVEFDANNNLSSIGYESLKTANKKKGYTYTDQSSIQEKAMQIIAEQPINTQESAVNQFINEHSSDEFETIASNFAKTQVRIDGIKPLYIIDGKEQVGFDEESLNPFDIESVNVWKDDLAIEIYGKKGKNGVVIITTKKYASKWAVAKKRNPETFDSSKPTKVKNLHYLANEDLDNPLIIIDGEEKPNGYEMDIIPETLESITVLKDASALDKYGEKGKNGVIEIKTIKARN